MSSTSPTIDLGEQITLQVGTVRFTTTAETLTSKSEFFKRFLSPTWRRPREDGSYFIDSDPVLFGHILQYLRRNTFPIFYDEVKGHDYAMYIRLQQEADYYLLHSLSEWLKKREYVRVIQTKYTIRQIDKEQHASFQAGAKITMYENWTTKKSYICPSGYHKRAGECNGTCERIRAQLGQQWETTRIFEGIIMASETVVNGDLCVDRS